LVEPTAAASASEAATASTAANPQRSHQLQHDRLTELKSAAAAAGAGGRRDSNLGGKFSIGPADQPGFMVNKKQMNWNGKSMYLL
jgi:hypothetical protein